MVRNTENAGFRKPLSPASLAHTWHIDELDLNDELIVHREPNEEMIFCVDVASGNIDKVEQNCREGHFYQMDEGIGQLSRDPVLNLKYHFVITIALVTRFCHEAGMEKEMAYRLSDFYIARLDDLSTIQGVIDLHDCAVLDFTRKMRMLKQNFAASKPVSDALNYIYAHIKDRLTIEEVAEAVGVSESHLSHSFKQDVGLSFSDYVREEKVKRAINLLKHSEYSLIDISNYLNFSSQSHFTQVFKKTTGMTPKSYRNELFQTAWKGLK